jgi:hypothetical protein
MKYRRRTLLLAVTSKPQIAENWGDYPTPNKFIS